MSLVEVNGHGVIDGRMWFPRSGAWRLELRVDSTEPITGPMTVSIADGRLVLRGTAWRGAEYVDTSHLNIVGGAGGLRSLARARAYNQTSLRIVLGDLAAGAGERMSATADSTTLARQLTAWTTAGLPVGESIPRALRSGAPSASWRVLPDGSIWVGPETWPDSGLTTDEYQILDEDPIHLTAQLGVEAPLLMPGTTMAGRRISRTEHAIDSEGVRTIVWFEDTATGTAPTSDRLRDAFGAAVRGAAGPVDYLAAYWARVIAQSGSTVDVEPENPTIARFLPSLQRVPLLMPAPGATVQMASVGRVLLGWSGGDPARPFAIGYDAATALVQLVLNSPDLRLGDTAALPFPNFAYRTADITKNDGLAAAFSALAAASTGPLAPLAAQFTAAAGALTTFELAAPTYLTTKAKAT